MPEVPVYISNNYGRLYASGNNVYVSTSQSSTSAMWYVQNLYPSLYSPGPVLTNVNSLKYLTTTTKDGTLTLSNTPKYFATCTNDYLNYEIIPSTLNLILTADKRLSTSNNKVLIQTYNSSNIYQKWNIEVAGECEIININYSLIDNNNIADIETEVIEGYLSNSVGSTATLSLALTSKLVNSSSWSKTSGFSLSSSTKFNVKVPFIKETIDLSRTSSETYSYGETTTKETTITHNVSVPVPPYTTYRVNLFNKKYTGDVRYVATVKSKINGVVFTQSGILRSVQSYSFGYKIYDPNENVLKELIF